MKYLGKKKGMKYYGTVDPASKDPWEKERQRLIKEIRAGKIDYDNSIVLATSDDIVFMTRPDMIPMAIESIESEFIYIK